MSYKRADEILPADILESLQNYVSGETIYVPKRKECRQSWGTRTGIRNNLNQRNERILSDYRNGNPIGELAKRYYLTEKSIQRILRNRKEKPPMGKQSSDKEEKN